MQAAARRVGDQADIGGPAAAADIPAQRQQPFSSLSGGEQTRIRLAVMILRETDILPLGVTPVKIGDVMLVLADDVLPA